VGSYLGWIFDGYEAFALIVALPPALRTLLAPEANGVAPIYAGHPPSHHALGLGIGGWPAACSPIIWPQAHDDVVGDL